MPIVYLKLKSGEPVIDFCRRNGISYNTVYLRIDKGIDADEAVSEVMLMKGNGRCYNNCKHYLKSGESLAKACKREGVNVGYCRKLMKEHGYTPDQALKREIRRMKYKKHIKELKNESNV